MSKNKALLIGINYMGTDNALNGCINDVQNVFSYLKERFECVNEVKWERSRSLSSSSDDEKDLGDAIESVVQHLRKKFETGGEVDSKLQTKLDFQQVQNVDMSHSTVDVLIMTDDKSIRNPQYPKRENIMRGIQWLVNGADENTHLLFHYSGHGTSVPDKNGDEMDGKDEALCPVDFASSGFILDDELNATLVAPLPKGCVLRVITDCCHSGSITDLHYYYDNAKFLANVNKDDSLKEDKKEKQVLADVVAWSGCMDNQTSADAYINGKFAGALTATFLELMRDKKQAHTFANLYEALLNRLRLRKYTQRPILSCSKPVRLTDVFDLF